MLTEVAFYCFAFLTLASALFILLSRQIIYAAFALILSFLSMAALFVLGGADFLAVVQIIVYIGGILVLLVFGIMLTSRVNGFKMLTEVTNKWLGIALSLGLFAMLFWVFLSANINSLNWIEAAIDEQNTTIEGTVSTIGIGLMSDYLLPFELVAVLLLIALIGAALLAKGGLNERKET